MSLRRTGERRSAVRRGPLLFLDSSQAAARQTQREGESDVARRDEDQNASSHGPSSRKDRAVTRRAVRFSSSVERNQTTAGGPQEESGMNRQRGPGTGLEDGHRGNHDASRSGGFHAGQVLSQARRARRLTSIVRSACQWMASGVSQAISWTSAHAGVVGKPASKRSSV
jgi:hypothetical protein